MATKRSAFSLEARARDDGADPDYFSKVYLKRAREAESEAVVARAEEVRRDRIPPCEFCHRDVGGAPVSFRAQLFMFSRPEREHHVLACQEKYRAAAARFSYSTAPDIPAELGAPVALSMRKKISDFFKANTTAPQIIGRLLDFLAPRQGSSFIVDGFQYTVPDAYYFLSHYHSDHYGPLKSSFSGVIFCSPYTARLLEEFHRVSASSIYPLELDRRYVIGEFTVTCIDANHCPGALMFLFEGPSGSFLHTGDFRFHPAHLGHPALVPYLTERSLDALYLDTTYSSPEYCFPPQSEVIHKVIEAVRRFHDGKTVFYFGTYTIGKERLFLEVARHFHVKVHASKRQHAILSMHRWPFDIGELLTEDAAALFQVTSMEVAGMKSLYHYLDDSLRYVGFLPTGWAMRFQSEQIAPNRYLFRVPYSEHSSYEELNTFCARVFYKTLVSTVASNAKVLKLFRATHPFCPPS